MNKNKEKEFEIYVVITSSSSSFRNRNFCRFLGFVKCPSSICSAKPIFGRLVSPFDTFTFLAFPIFHEFFDKCISMGRDEKHVRDARRLRLFCSVYTAAPTGDGNTEIRLFHIELEYTIKARVHLISYFYRIFLH